MNTYRLKFVRTQYGEATVFAETEEEARQKLLTFPLFTESERLETPDCKVRIPQAKLEWE